MMKRISLQSLASTVGGDLRNGCRELSPPTSFTTDSRKVTPNSLFVAYKGAALDSHRFLDQAFESGAVAALVEDQAALGSRPGIVVSDGRRVLSQLAALWYGSPSDDLLCVGVTGTNGKTSVHWLVHHALKMLGRDSLLVGTLGIFHGDTEYENDAVTTPSAPVLHAAIRDAAKNGARCCSLEVSSHGVDQHRITDVQFDVGVYLNLTPDHLDYHGTLENYFEAKLSFFRLLSMQRKAGKKQPVAVVNLDCPYGERVVEVAREGNVPYRTFGSSTDADLVIESFEQSLDGSTLTVRIGGDTYSIRTPLIGDFNGSNLTAAVGALMSCGYSPDKLAQVIPNLPIVPGRLERVPSKHGAVFVDYAHAPDALRSALTTVKPLVERDLWVVFGSGGGRVPTRRAGMGAAADEIADQIVITSDNPRNEEPMAIIDAIKAACPRARHIEPDRRKAIRYAIERMQPGDVVVVAGKGHEPYQEINGEKLPFLDIEEVSAALKQCGLER